MCRCISREENDFSQIFSNEKAINFSFTLMIFNWNGAQPEEEFNQHTHSKCVLSNYERLRLLFEAFNEHFA